MLSRLLALSIHDSEVFVQVLNGGTTRWKREIGNEAEMVADPHASDRFIEETRAGGDFEGWPTVVAAAHEDVVDASERPVPISHQGITRREGMARIDRMLTLPGISIADAHTSQGLMARPEAYTGCIRIGIEVTCQHHMQIAYARTLFYEACGSDGL